MKFSRLLVVSAMAAAVAFAGGQAVSAGSNSANMTVTATVSANCTVSASPLTWTAFDTVTGSGADTTTKLSIACTKGTAANVAMGPGLATANGTRNMKKGSDSLAYDIYTASDYGTVWSDTSKVSLVAAPSKVAREVDVYGRIVASNDVPAGVYTDTVSVTVDF
jgi:spore coat protein U-like protein